MATSNPISVYTGPLTNRPGQVPKTTAPRYGPNEASGALAVGNDVVKNGPAILDWISITAVGAVGTLTIHDNASTNSGKVIIIAQAADGTTSTVHGLDTNAENGLYYTLAGGTSTAYLGFK